MNILIVANHFAVCSARYAADAFTWLGHTVRHVGTPMGRNIWGIQVPQEYVWEPDTDMLGAGWADVAIYMDSDPSVLDRFDLYQLNIVWGVDNHVRDYRRPYFDHYFFAHKSVSVMPWQDAETFNYHDAPAEDGKVARALLPGDMTWLPCAYDPVAFPPSPIPWNEREYDVCCLGVMYPRRRELVNAMRAAGLKVLAGSGLVYEAYRDAHHNSRVALVSSFNGDLPIRTFESSGLGCAVLSDDTPDLRLLDESNPVSIYCSVDDAVQLARSLQTRSDLAVSCAKWAANHTWDKRAQKVVEWYNTRTA